MDGRSLAAALRRGRIPAPSEFPEAVVESLEPWLGFGWAPLAGIRTAAWKMIRAPRPELYDLAADPSEKRNRWDDRRRVGRELAAKLAAREGGERTVSASADPASASALRSLGYLSGAASPSTPVPADAADPKDRIATKQALDRAEQALASTGRDAALAAFAEVLRGEPTNRYALLRSGALLLDAGRGEEAIARFEALLRLDPSHGEARFLLASARTEAGPLEAAAAEWSEVTRRQPARAAGWGNLGTVLFRLGKPVEAEGALERAHALEPANETFRENLGAVRVERLRGRVAAGDAAGARGVLDRIRNDDPAMAARLESDPALARLLSASPAPH